MSVLLQYEAETEAYVSKKQLINEHNEWTQQINNAVSFFHIYNTRVSNIAKS